MFMDFDILPPKPGGFFKTIFDSAAFADKKDEKILRQHKIDNGKNIRT